VDTLRGYVRNAELFIDRGKIFPQSVRGKTLP
jgi:hypothetical protein